MKHLVLVFCALLLALPAHADVGVTDAMNAYRAGKGRAAVAYSPKLEKAALRHVNDMVKRKFFSHTGSNGSNVGRRVKRAGYKWCFVAENIAGGHKSFDRAFAAWKNSAPHRENMLNRKVREIGVAKGAGGNWVLVMASPC